jgi:prevent-host-death family protein
MIHIPVSEFKNEIAETLNRVIYAGERVLLQRHNKDVVALVSMKELSILEEIEAMEDDVDLKEAQRVLQKIKSNETEVLSLDEAKKELDL